MKTANMTDTERARYWLHKFRDLRQSLNGRENESASVKSVVEQCEERIAYNEQVLRDAGLDPYRVPVPSSKPAPVLHVGTRWPACADPDPTGAF